MIRATKTNRRVVVTGIGIICSLGVSLKEFWENCLSNNTKVENIPKKWHDYATFTSTIWSPLPEIAFGNYGISNIESMKLDVSAQLAMATTYMALENAGIEKEMTNLKNKTYSLKAIDPARTGVIYGTGIGGSVSMLASHAYQALANHKNDLAKIVKNSEGQGNESFKEQLTNINNKMLIPNRFNPFVASMSMPNACSSNISIKYGITGPSNTLCSACASGTVAIGHAYRAIKHNIVDIAVTGATEYLHDDYGSHFRGFDILGALAQDKGDKDKANRPFDKKRCGFLFSEGASATLILEDLEHAINRGAEILGEIIGFSESCDANNIMIIEKNSPHIKRMIINALDEAGLNPGDIDYINTHGTGTLVNDEIEANIINDLFGKKPLVNATKSLLGHTIGASGAIEAVVSLLSMKNNKTHICNNLEEPILDLNFVTKVKESEINTAISPSYGFGGHNSVLVMKDFHTSSML